MNPLRASLVIVLTTFGLAACTTDQYGNRRPMTDTERGALIGAASGAIIGGLASKHKSKGALIGAIGGGLAGAAVGAYMDKQKQDLEKALTPERSAGDIGIDKLDNNVLRITMTGQTAFDSGSVKIKRGFDSTMDKISEVVTRYGKTSLVVVGHTDDVGSTQFNQRLSEQRAQAVTSYLSAKGIIPERLDAEGRGESSPRASNATAAGRRSNRRVEIYIEPVVAQS